MGLIGGGEKPVLLKYSKQQVRMILSSNKVMLLLNTIMWFYKI